MHNLNGAPMQGDCLNVLHTVPSMLTQLFKTLMHHIVIKRHDHSISFCQTLTSRLYYRSGVLYYTFQKRNTRPPISASFSKKSRKGGKGPSGKQAVGINNGTR